MLYEVITFNLISALHKSVRGSDVEGALYWLARMIEGGEDPMYLARRVITSYSIHYTKLYELWVISPVACCMRRLNCSRP